MQDKPLYKHYVDVITLISKDGSVTPLAMIWQGKRYEIDKIIKVRETFSDAGGCGIRYSCRFGNEVRQLFWERDRWFLESSVKPMEETQKGQALKTA